MFPVHRPDPLSWTTEIRYRGGSVSLSSGRHEPSYRAAILLVRGECLGVGRGGDCLQGDCSKMELHDDEEYNQELLSFFREQYELFYVRAIAEGVKDPVVLIYEVHVA